MRLRGFKYLKIGRILTLTLIITISSTLFSLTALTLLGFYKGFAAYLGEEEDIIALYDKKSRTPFTGLVPTHLVEKIRTINGVVAASPEAIAPCIIKNDSVFLRGIIPEELTKINELTIIEGDMLDLDDPNAAIVGKNVVERLHINPNDKILALGVLTDRYVELQVKGIFVSHSPMDDEILTPLYVGQWLRGTNYAHATLIRIKIDRNTITPTEIFEEISKEAAQHTPPQTTTPSTTPSQKPPTITPRIVAKFKIEDIGVEETYTFMKSYLDRYGLTKESFLILSTLVFLFSGASIAAASKTIIAQHKGEINILRSIGASKRLLKRDLLTKLLPWSFAASAIGFAAAIALLTVIQGSGYLRVLSHTIPLHIDPLLIALNFILTTLILSLSILHSDL